MGNSVRLAAGDLVDGQILIKAQEVGGSQEVAALLTKLGPPSLSWSPLQGRLLGDGAKTV